MTPSAEMRNALKEVSVEVLGVKDGGAFIGLVTDTSNGLTDGTITANEDILIEGDKLKIVLENEEAEIGSLGVFFVDVLGNVTQVTRRLTQNDPKKIIARVPHLQSGEYTLRVITRYTSGNNLLKEPRTIDYDRLLIVV